MWFYCTSKGLLHSKKIMLDVVHCSIVAIYTTTKVNRLNVH